MALPALISPSDGRVHLQPAAKASNTNHLLPALDGAAGSAPTATAIAAAAAARRHSQQPPLPAPPPELHPIKSVGSLLPVPSKGNLAAQESRNPTGRMPLLSGDDSMDGLWRDHQGLAKRTGGGDALDPSARTRGGRGRPRSTSAPKMLTRSQYTETKRLPSSLPHDPLLEKRLPQVRSPPAPIAPGYGPPPVASSSSSAATAPPSLTTSPSMPSLPEPQRSRRALLDPMQNAGHYLEVDTSARSAGGLSSAGASSLFGGVGGGGAGGDVRVLDLERPPGGDPLRCLRPLPSLQCRS